MLSSSIQWHTIYYYHGLYVGCMLHHVTLHYYMRQFAASLKHACFLLLLVVSTSLLFISSFSWIQRWSKVSKASHPENSAFKISPSSRLAVKTEYLRSIFKWKEKPKDQSVGSPSIYHRLTHSWFWCYIMSMRVWRVENMRITDYKCHL